jgi:hypothetical protein
MVLISNPLTYEDLSFTKRAFNKACELDGDDVVLVFNTLLD